MSSADAGGQPYRDPSQGGIVNQDSNPRISKVGTVGVPVTDQDRALQFYVDTLGFTKTLDAPFGGGQRWIEVAPAGATTTIALAPTPEGKPVGVDTGIRLFTADADADHAYLTGQGVDADAEVMRWPGVPAMFSFRDPDGNTLYLVESS
jgi:predicted enzyme related to lactoylglutathione lyase